MKIEQETKIVWKKERKKNCVWRFWVGEYGHVGCYNWVLWMAFTGLCPNRWIYGVTR